MIVYAIKSKRGYVSRRRPYPTVCPTLHGLSIRDFYKSKENAEKHIAPIADYIDRYFHNLIDAFDKMKVVPIEMKEAR